MPLSVRFEGFAYRLFDPSPETSEAVVRARKLLPGWRHRELYREDAGQRTLVSSPRRPERWSLERAFDEAYRLGLQEGVTDVEPLFAVEEPRTPVADETLRSGGGGRRIRDPRWAVERVRADQVWDTSLGQGVLVAHPDTGYTEHPEIYRGPQHTCLDLSRGVDFLDGGLPEDDLNNDWWKLDFPGHGTTTASVIASDHGGEVLGMAPAAKIVPLRVSETVIDLSYGRLIQAVSAAIEMEADIISMSRGGPLDSETLEQVLQRAIESGMIVVAAAGNIWRWDTYPAGFASIVGVGASDVKNRLWRHSNPQDWVEISAPGVDVFSAKLREEPEEPLFKQDPATGTSLATAMVAGAAALWLSHHGGRKSLNEKYPGRVQSIFRQALADTATSFDTLKGPGAGAGLLNVEALLAWPLPSEGETRTRSGSRVRTRRNLFEIEDDLRRLDIVTTPRAEASETRAPPRSGPARTRRRPPMATYASGSLRAYVDEEAQQLIEGIIAGEAPPAGLVPPEGAPPWPQPPQTATRAPPRLTLPSISPQLRTASAPPGAPPAAVVTFDVADKHWRTTADYSYPDPRLDAIFSVRKGFRFDLSSIPRPVWPLIGPHELSVEAPLIHDLLYRFQGQIPVSEGGIRPFVSMDQHQSDLLFHRMMLRYGVPQWKADVAYWTLFLFGHFFWEAGSLE